MVVTTADVHRDAAIEQIQMAIKQLSEIVVGKCWGWDDYTRIYYSKLIQAHTDLLRIEEALR